MRQRTFTKLLFIAMLGALTPQFASAQDCISSEFDFENFDNNIGIWNDGGSDFSQRINREGSWSIRLRDNSSSSNATTDILDFSGASEATISFSVIAESMEAGESFVLEYSLNNGATYTIAKTWVSGTDFENRQEVMDAVTIVAPFTANTLFRFRNDASSNFDFIFLDNIRISSCTVPAVVCEVDADGDGVCAADDCNDADANVSAAGAACNDGDATTENDTVQDDCTCAGTVIPTATCNLVEYDFSDISVDLDSRLWNDGGNDCSWKVSPNGSRSIRLRDNSSSSFSDTDIIDFSGTTDAQVNFDYITNSMEAGEDFFLEYSIDGGANYAVAQSYISGIDFQNGESQVESVAINANFSATTRFRFRCDASSNYDRVYIDNIRISNCQSPIEGDTVVIDTTVIVEMDTIVADPVGSCALSTFNTSDFDNGYGIWIDGGNDAGIFPARGNNPAYVVLRDNNGQRSSIYTAPTDFSAATEIQLSFMLEFQSMENGEDLFLEYSLDGGITFITAEQWIRGTNYNNRENLAQNVSIADAFTANTVIRFRADASSNFDLAYIEDITINTLTCADDAIEVADDNVETVPAMDTTTTAPVDTTVIEAPVDTTIVPNPDTILVGLKGDLAKTITVATEVLEYNIFPNPTADILNVNLTQYIGKDVQVSLYNILGNEIGTQRFAKLEQAQVSFDLTTASTGAYLIRVDAGNGDVITKQFSVVK